VQQSVVMSTCLFPRVYESALVDGETQALQHEVLPLRSAGPSGARRKANTVSNITQW